MMRQRIVGYFFSAFVIAIASFLLIGQGPVIRAQSGTCTSGSYLEESLPSGGRWDFCWSEQPQQGIVLRDVYYTTPAGLRRKVLAEASLAQIEVRYDDGLATLYPLSQPGLGGDQLLSLSAADCPDGVVLSQENRALLCKQIAARGYLNKYYTQQRQGDAFTIFSASQIGQQLYIVQWRFFEDGTLEPQVAEAGRLLRQGMDAQYGWQLNNRIGIGYITNYWWRLDFDLGGNGANDLVEEFEVNPASANTQLVSSASPLNSETGRTTDPDKKHSWRVRDTVLINDDGHAISYHLIPKQVGYRDAGSNSQPWNQHDFYVTVAHACELLAIHNPTSAGCGDNLADFVNGESTAGNDIVVWYRITAHRLPRAEDTPMLDLQWQSFQLLPRDWTAQSPF